MMTLSEFWPHYLRGLWIITKTGVASVALGLTALMVAALAGAALRRVL